MSSSKLTWYIATECTRNEATREVEIRDAGTMIMAGMFGLNIWKPILDATATTESEGQNTTGGRDQKEIICLSHFEWKKLWA
jgi:hypothetical protein